MILSLSERSRIWRENNKDKVNQYAKEYYKRKVIHIRLYQKNYRKDNPIKMRRYYETQYKKRIILIKKYAKQYWKDNKEVLSEKYKNWSQKNQFIVRRAGYRYFVNNKDKVHIRNKIYRQKNIQKVLFWIRKRKVTSLGIKHDFTNEQWLVKVKQTKGRCPECNKMVGYRKLTMDHIIPLSSGRKRIYTIQDIQPLCKSCNSSKGSKIIVKTDDKTRNQFLEIIK